MEKKPDGQPDCTRAIRTLVGGGCRDCQDNEPYTKAEGLRLTVLGDLFSVAW